MNPKKIWANVGVKDVEQTRKFYNDLGFKSNEGRNKGKELTSFLIGSDDFLVHFFLNDRLKESMKGKLANLEQGNEVIFTLWAENKKEVDTWAEEVRNAGGKIFSEPEEARATTGSAFQTQTGISGMSFTCNKLRHDGSIEYNTAGSYYN